MPVQILFISMNKNRKYTKEYLELLVKDVYSYSSLLKKIGIKQTGGSHRLISMRIKEYGIDISHFTGQGWSNGKTKETDYRIQKISDKLSTPMEEIFCKNSGFSTTRLYEKLLEIGWKNECKICGLIDWRGEKIRLHVDHINGNHSDNRVENLRFLCPNCHQQTDTWGAKNGAVPRIKKQKTERKKRVCGCGGFMSFDSKMCRRCRNKIPRKTKQPIKELLENDILNIPMTKIGEKYGVSDNAVKKWCRFYNINIPPMRGYWQKKQAGKV